MSLTEILSRPEVAAQFNKYVRFPHDTITRSPPAPLIVPCAHQFYALVGTAFDYCMRFCLAAANQGLVREQTWIAEIALQIIEEEEVHLPAGLTLSLARGGLRRSRELYEQFLQTRLFTRKLARAALFLAALDRAYRRARRLSSSATSKTRFTFCLQRRTHHKDHAR